MRRLELAINLFVVFGPSAIGLLIFVLLTPPLTAFGSFTCFGAGLALLGYAKCDMFKQRIWFSCGPSRMTRNGRTAYWQAYGFIAVGVILNLITQFVLHGRA